MVDAEEGIVGRQYVVVEYDATVAPRHQLERHNNAVSLCFEKL